MLEKEVNKRINLTWFYPRICKYLDKIGDKNDYFRFLAQEGDGDEQEHVPLLLYIHIPFCETFCAYCACFKERLSDYTYEDRKTFIQAMVKEMEMYARTPLIKKKKVGYIQIGGGSPSCLEVELYDPIFECIHKHFDLAENHGISFEGNVMTSKDPAKLEKIRDLGVTRISFGVQTFNEKIRKAVAIRAKIADIYETVAAINRVRFPSFALDLIYNLPGENFEILGNDLEKACQELKPDFIQTYRFNQFANTWLDEKINRGDFDDPPTPQKELDMFRFIMEQLQKKGYANQVLINFFGKGNQSPYTGIEHSMGNNRFNGSHMLGIGPGSMSYMGSHNYKTYPSIKQYVSDIEAGVFPVEAGHISSMEERKSRLMVFFPNFTRIKWKDVPQLESCAEKIDYLLENGYVERSSDELVLTTEGKLWAGNISYLFYTNQERKKLQKSFYYSLTHHTNPFNQDRMNVVSR